MEDNDLQLQTLVWLKRTLIHAIILWVAVNLGDWIMYLYKVHFDLAYTTNNGAIQTFADRFVNHNFRQPFILWVLLITCLAEVNYLYIYLKKNFWLFIAGCIVLAALGGVISLLFNAPDPFIPRFSQFLAAGVTITVYITFYAALAGLATQRNREARRAQKQSQSELNLLKAQINPHFFFNTLNNIYGMALRENAGQTANAVELLSGMMRYNMDGMRKDKISLKKELKFIEDYIELQKLRIPQNAAIKINIDIQHPHADYHIAPMLLIPMIENAFKYGLSVEKPCFVDLKIVVEDQRLIMLINNSIFPDSAKEKGSGMGIENVKQRLDIIYPGLHEFSNEKRGEVYQVKLNIFLADAHSRTLTPKRWVKMMLTVCLLATVQFSSAQKSNTKFVVKGKFDELHASKVYLLYQTEGKRIIDSAIVTGNQFRFGGNCPDYLFATLVADHGNMGLKQLMKQPVDGIDMLKFYLHSGNITLGGKDSVNTADFTLSAVNKDYARLKTLLGLKEEHKLYALSAKMQKLRTPEAEKRYVSFDDSLKEVRRPLLKKFAVENPASYIALVALKEYAGAFPDTKEIITLYNALSNSIKQTKSGLDFGKLLDSNISIGSIAPDFQQADTAGNSVRLSSLRGKYVLIDFWASWCPSCREENPALVKAYHELKDKNFTILGVSLDGHDTKAAWLNAIRNDGLDWLQVSDLKHWDNEVIKAYGINAIPQNVLLDPTGRVIAKNIEADKIKDKLAAYNK